MYDKEKEMWYLITSSFCFVLNHSDTSILFFDMQNRMQATEMIN